MMKRKSLSIFCLLLAYIILLGHNIIPHHHHETHSDVIVHHDTHHMHDIDQDEQDLGHLFSHFVHPEYAFTTFVHQNTPGLSDLDLFTLIACIPDVLNFSFSASSSIPFRPPIGDNIFNSPLQNAHSLRGPPAFFS
jgi:hypothetical protein